MFKVNTQLTPRGITQEIFDNMLESWLCNNSRREYVIIHHIHFRDDGMMVSWERREYVGKHVPDDVVFGNRLFTHADFYMSR